MAIPELSEEGLLPAGIHTTTMDEIAGMFGGNSIRRALLAGLRRYVADVGRRQFARLLIIDGSFVTAAAEPHDIDAILVLQSDYDLHRPVSPYEYNLRSTRMVRKEYGLDLFSVRADSLEYLRFVELFTQVRNRPELIKGLLQVQL